MQAAGNDLLVAPDYFERSPSGEIRDRRERAQLRDEIRPSWHFRSSLYNTDPQVLSDAGIPVVLFMEDYKIDRQGYHDSKDTVESIDLDVGRAIAAIAIETVAQLAR